MKVLHWQMHASTDLEPEYGLLICLGHIVSQATLSLVLSGLTRTTEMTLVPRELRSPLNLYIMNIELSSIRGWNEKKAAKEEKMGSTRWKPVRSFYFTVEINCY